MQIANDDANPAHDLCSLVESLLSRGHTPIEIAAGLVTASASLILDAGGDHDSCHMAMDCALLTIRKADESGIRITPRH